MALNNVYMRDNAHGLVRISSVEVARLYSYLGVDSRQLVCGACMQHTSFYLHGKYKTPTFRHPTGSNDCDEKLSVERSIRTQTNPLGFSLPMRIKLDKQLNISVGFLPIGEPKLCEAEKKGAQVCIVPFSGGRVLPGRTYNVDSFRFSTDHISYLDIGNVIADQYRLSLTSEERFSIGADIWPRYVDGFNSEGTLFDFASGKRLPNRSTVAVGRDFYLFTKSNYLRSHENVSCSFLRCYDSWNVYQVRASNLSDDSVEFFRRLNMFLTDVASSVTLLWPIGVRSSHIISFCGRETHFHKTGGHISVHPTNATMIQRNDMLFSVISDFQQILSVSRFENQVGVLRYVLLRNEKEIVRVKEPKAILMFDIEENLINDGIHNKLPLQKKVVFSLEYDGFVNVKKGNINVAKMSVKAGIRTIIDVEFNRTYQVFQGLDAVAEISFERSMNRGLHTDDDIVKKLQGFHGMRIPIKHSLGTIAAHLSDYPRTRNWLLKQIRLGTINEDALTWLKSAFGRMIQHV